MFIYYHVWALYGIKEYLEGVCHNAFLFFYVHFFVIHLKSCLDSLRSHFTWWLKASLSYFSYGKLGLSFEKHFISPI